MIVFSDVSVKFGDKFVLDGLNLKIGDGVTAIVGQSGCGKTTVLRLIGGLIKPTGGTVECSYKRPSFVFQEHRLLPWLSALKNVTAVNENKPKEKAVELLHSLGISDGDMQKKPSQLSGGMRQRVCIARALFYGGDILLLDEPFNGLDENNRAKAASLIRQVSQSVPVVLVSHIAEDVKTADTVIKLEELK